MENKQHQLAVQEAVKKKFKGNETVKSRSIPKYPESAEREFKRITNGYIRLLNETLKEHLPAVLRAYKRERSDSLRYDDTSDFDIVVDVELQKVAEELEQKLSEYGLYKLVDKIAILTKTNSLREWKRVCRDTLGIDLMDDYYNGSFYEEALRRWVDENVMKIKSLPNEALGNMKSIILKGYRSGKSMTEMSKEVQKEYSLTRRKAQLLARDQISSLNAQISKLQQKDAGCTQYRWSDSHDSRVRPCHHELNGQVFDWDDPPEMWYETKGKGRVYTGRRCCPGEDYCCRCVAIPVFNYTSIDLPYKEATAVRK